MVILLFQIYYLIRYFNRVNRDLANFIVYLHENDTSVAYNKARIDRNFTGVTGRLVQLVAKFQKTRLEKEQKQHYLQAVIEHAGTGIAAINKKNEIEFINRTALDMLQIPGVNFLSNIKNSYPEIYRLFTETDLSHNKPLQIKTPAGTLSLTVKLTILSFDNDEIRIISFQDIKKELDEQELESWRKFIMLLRHEIMNSITPITTLTEAIRRNFKEKNNGQTNGMIGLEIIEDTLASVDVIEERSKGLVDFVERFKSLTNPPVPVIKEFPVSKLLETIQALFSNQFREKGIELGTSLSNPNLTIRADEKLLEQVLINLLKNSIEAINHKNGKIIVSAFRKNNEKTVIVIEDNGSGISKENATRIFVPSFTTKEGGSGIGLSLSKQIIRQHSGTLSISAGEGAGTVVKIEI